VGCTDVQWYGVGAQLFGPQQKILAACHEAERQGYGRPPDRDHPLPTTLPRAAHRQKITMDRHGKARSQQTSSRNIIVEPPTDATPSAPRSRGDVRKVRMEEQWDADSLDALRGYAPLSRDATTAKELSWQHLKHESKQEVQDRPGTSSSSSDMVEVIETRPEHRERRQVSLADMVYREREDDTDSQTTTEDFVYRERDVSLMINTTVIVESAYTVRAAIRSHIATG
jgi:hypothetical protein